MAGVPKPCDTQSSPEHRALGGDDDGRAARPGDRRDRFARGLRLGLPIFLGYSPVGAAFGVLAIQLGFTVSQAVVCSATALAGAGQFIALSVLGSGAGAVSALIATTVVNLRYVLFATTMAPRVAGAGPATLGWLGFTLTDETFAVNVADQRVGLATPASMAGVGAVAWMGWVLGTLAGSLGAGLIGDPTRWGVDFAMPAMFAALFVALAEDRRHIVVGLGAGAIALALPSLARAGVMIPTAWHVVIASMAAATLASAALRD